MVTELLDYNLQPTVSYNKNQNVRSYFLFFYFTANLGVKELVGRISRGK